MAQIASNSSNRRNLRCEENGLETMIMITSTKCEFRQFMSRNSVVRHKYFNGERYIKHAHTDTHPHTHTHKASPLKLKQSDILKHI